MEIHRFRGLREIPARAFPFRALTRRGRRPVHKKWNL
jgi:hypothetical protein